MSTGDNHAVFLHVWQTVGYWEFRPASVICPFCLFVCFVKRADNCVKYLTRSKTTPFFFFFTLEQ